MGIGLVGFNFVKTATSPEVAVLQGGAAACSQPAMNNNQACGQLLKVVGSMIHVQGHAQVQTQVRVQVTVLVQEAVQLAMQAGDM